MCNYKTEMLSLIFKNTQFFHIFLIIILLRPQRMKNNFSITTQVDLLCITLLGW
jgi:hypothetical protein